MGRLIAFLYGVLAYVVFFVAILYSIGFVTGLGVPKTIDTGTEVPLLEAIVVNLALMTLFALPAQRDGASAIQGVVDAHRAACDRAQHLCAAREPGITAAVLAVAADPGGSVAGEQPPGRRVSARPRTVRLGGGLPEHVPDQSF